ncbi:unnamed protein product [Cuscuta epithymum]|uniref:Zinc finger GRF-type domain-containing protein n=1 Tax=Cuscuta epithymum TaxID=186058 RepID=A0AAV0C8Y7_9ASTE|nr:unnamed protein product [Cuscuta epithymum]
MSSSSTSSLRKNSLCTLNYEPAVYCLCGMKAPLCKGRESERMFYGCQQWKHNRGCGFCGWKDAMDATYGGDGHVPHCNTRDEGTYGGGFVELQRANSSFDQGIHLLRRDIGYLTGVVQTEGGKNKRFRLIFGCCCFVNIVVVAMVYFTLKNSCMR